jgi:hypothetical protein
MTRAQMVLTPALALILGLALTLLISEPAPGVTQANYNRLRQGQTIEDASTILGGPPGYYQTKNAQTIFMSPKHPVWAGAQWWIGDDLAIAIVLDGSGHISSFTAFRPPTEPPRWNWVRKLLYK